MLYITNKDRPGVIGDLGARSRIMASISRRSTWAARVLATMQLLLQVDDAVPETVVDQLENLNNIVQVKAGSFKASSCVCGPFLPFVLCRSRLGGSLKPATVGKVDGLSNIVASKDGKTAYAVAQGKYFAVTIDGRLNGPVEAPVWPSPPTDMIPHGNVAVGQNHIEKAWLVQPTLRYGHGALGDKIEAGGFKVQLRDGRELVYELADQYVFEDLGRVSPMSMAMGWMKSFLFGRPFGRRCGFDLPGR